MTEAKKAFLVEENGRRHSLDDLASQVPEGKISVGRTERGSTIEIAKDLPGAIIMMISKHHATIVRKEGDGFYIQDNKSTNGTRINDHRLNGEYVKLEHGDEIFFGNCYRAVYAEE